MEDGKGVLADGTRYEKQTTEEFGADGYWLRTTVMRGVSAGGKVRSHVLYVPFSNTQGFCLQKGARGYCCLPSTLLRVPNGDTKSFRSLCWTFGSHTAATAFPLWPL